jgi:hypothetical protein
MAKMADHASTAAKRTGIHVESQVGQFTPSPPRNVVFPRNQTNGKLANDRHADKLPLQP